MNASDEASFHESDESDESGAPPMSERIPTALTFREIAESYVDFVFRSLRRAGLDHAAADDATQQVFLVVATKIGSIERGRERGFLYATARNVASQYKKRTVRRGEIVLEDEESFDAATMSANDAPSLDELIDQRRARDVLDQVLDEMPEKLREAFVLCEIEGLTGVELAACIDVPVGTAWSRLRRAREVFDQIVVRVRSQRAFQGTQ